MGEEGIMAADRAPSLLDRMAQTEKMVFHLGEECERLSRQVRHLQREVGVDDEPRD